MQVLKQMLNEFLLELDESLPHSTNTSRARAGYQSDEDDKQRLVNGRWFTTEICARLP